MNQEMPQPICEICGFKQNSFNGMVIYTHYGVFCPRCLGRYEPRLKKLCEHLCKAEVKAIIKERKKNKEKKDA